MADTPESIAARLSAAQRRALLWLPADGSNRQWRSADGIQFAHKALRDMRLADAKVDRRSWVMMRRATEEGQAVRAVLEREARDAE